MLNNLQIVSNFVMVDALKRLQADRRRIGRLAALLLGQGFQR
jgi:hypothetical protein